MEALLIFPHHLFESHPGLKKGREVLCIEAPRFFSDFLFHKQKLVLHRAALKSYESALKKKGFSTHYVEDDLESALKKLRISKVVCAELDDHTLQNNLDLVVKKLGLQQEVVPNPSFLTSAEEFQGFVQGRPMVRFDTFYIRQRKKLDLLLDERGKPEGGRWSLDSENRKRAPRSLKMPQLQQCAPTDEVKEAIHYVEKKYPSHPGSLLSFTYPTTHEQARHVLRDFLEHRLSLFGDYEDAILQKELLLFHSCLSPAMNIGLLTAQEVLQETIHFAQRHPVPLNSLEGFIRQIIGWREFVRGVYGVFGEKQRGSNFFKHKRKIPKAFYLATTGILPIDETIKKIEGHAYVHHIERLMVLGNFFLLCEVDPHEVYRWFMELFIDAYDWVMVPNVYGMSQYADGGIMTTKPYISGSNYILKMSDYPKGEWCAVWDALFWRFMIHHERFFQAQPRMNVLCGMLEKKKQDKHLLRTADSFLASLD